MNKKLSGPWPKFSFSLSVALILACTAAGLAAQKKNSAVPAGSVFAQDKGKLTIKLDGQTVGHEEFEITPSAGGWLAKGNADITPAQSAASKVFGSPTLQPDGARISNEWTSQAEKTNGANIVFADGVAEMTLQMRGNPPYEQGGTVG